MAQKQPWLHTAKWARHGVNKNSCFTSTQAINTIWWISEDNPSGSPNKLTAGMMNLQLVETLREKMASLAQGWTFLNRRNIKRGVPFFLDEKTFLMCWWVSVCDSFPLSVFLCVNTAVLNPGRRWLSARCLIDCREFFVCKRWPVSIIPGVCLCVCVCVCVCIWVCIIKSECTVSRSECVNMWACLCQYSLFFLHTASVCSYFISVCVCVCVCVCISVCVGAYLHAFHPAGAERQLRAAPPDNTAQNGNTEPVMMTGLYSRRRNAAAWR